MRATNMLWKAVKIPTRPYQLHSAGRDDFKGPGKNFPVNKDQLLNMFESMFRIRRAENKSDELYKKSKIRGFCHLCTGQEAVYVGMEEALTKENDAIITSYRDHGIYMLRGGNLHTLFAEMLGKGTGASGGKGGSMHLYQPATHFYGGNGIVGAQCPLGAGIAYAFKYNGEQQGGPPTGVCVTMYGDGAANQGQLFEAYNMASLWKLPVIFVCENNYFAMGTSIERGSGSPQFYNKCPYIPGIKVDGMDVFSVAEAFRYAKEWALAEGPVLMELDTYRYVGHSMSDPGTSYRTDNDVDLVKAERDAIAWVRATLSNEFGVEDSVMKTIEDGIKKEITAAVKQAEADAVPSPDRLFTDVVLGENVVRGVSVHDNHTVVNV